MTAKLEDSNTAPKIYWAILNQLLYNKKIPAIPLVLVDCSFISDYRKEINFFQQIFCFYMHTYKNFHCQPFYIRPTPEQVLFEFQIRIYY